jgi:hypothetical protein
MGVAGSSREGANGPKVYRFVSDFWARIEELTPNLRTYKLQAQRSDDRLVSSIQYAQRELAKAQPEEQTALHRRIEKLSAQRIPHLERLHDDMTTEQIELFAFDVALPSGLHPAKQKKLDGLHATARMDVAEAKRSPEWEAAKFAATKTSRLATDTAADNVAVIAPIAPVVIPVAHRWQFVGQNELLLTELERSLSSEDSEKRTAAHVLKSYFDGAHNDFGKAKYAAYQMGVAGCRGIMWGSLQAEAAQP